MAKEKTESASRPALSDEDEARLEAVAAEFPERKDAVAYGRKILKVAAGLRATAPPLVTLTKEEGLRVYEILGVEPPAPKAKAEATPVEEPEPVAA